jgi:5'-3' exonuclease
MEVFSMKGRECDLLLVDGKHLFWRSASATMLSIAEEAPTGGIYAFIRALTRIHEEHGGEIVICWEGGPRRDLVRTEMLPEYKNRGEPDEERRDLLDQMFSQLDRLTDLLRALGITQVKAPGWEADDAIATLARRAEERGHRAAIFSGDSDLCQCVSDHVFMLRPIGKEVVTIDRDGVDDWLGVRPGLVPLLKGLAGDSSDNIPGVPGIGKVTGVRLVNEYGSIYGILSAVKRDEKPSIPRFSDRAWESLKKSVTDGQLILSWRLAKVNRRAHVDFDFSSLDRKALVKGLVALRFKSLLGNREMYRLRKLTEST